MDPIKQANDLPPSYQSVYPSTSNQNVPPPAYPGLPDNKNSTPELNFVSHPYSANQNDPTNAQSMTYVSRMVPVRDYGSTIAVHRTTSPISPTNVIILGNCPVCRVGVLRDETNVLGLCLAILFFPVGILCCLALEEKRCDYCRTRIE